MLPISVALLGLTNLVAAAAQTSYTPFPTGNPRYSYDIDCGDDGGDYGSSPDTTTFLPATATNANPVTTAPAVDGGKAYYTYTAVPGFFQQDNNATNASTFDYIASNFGLINRTYDGETSRAATLKQWQRFNRHLHRLNADAPDDVSYKLIFIGRHGEGYHNAAEAFYGTPAWNCFWSLADGNSTASWSDARLTPTGLLQAQRASTLWTRLLATQEITPPQEFYVSPLTRCLQTVEATFRNISLPRGAFVPKVKEYLREGVSVHTCDRRATRSDITARYPSYDIEDGFAEHDPLWTGVVAEQSTAQDYRSRVLLDDVFDNSDAEVLSFTTHSGETASLLRVVGHRAFGLVTGAVIPVLVKASKVRASPPATTTSVYRADPWCTNGPPVTSVAGSGCVCSAGVTATALRPELVFTTGNPKRRSVEQWKRDSA